MITLNARNLSLDDVQSFLKIEEQENGSFTPLLSLEPLTEFEHQELIQIRKDFRSYMGARISEGQVKLLAIAPLLRLAGFYHHPIKITLEEGIADINITDEDTIITGRMDILAINKVKSKVTNTPFWVLVIESKNSLVDALAGLPQLLTYSSKSLEHQTSVWGLTTNGVNYQFVYIQQGNNHPTYQLLPSLNLMESERAIQILQVLKAICKL